MDKKIVFKKVLIQLFGVVFFGLGVAAIVLAGIGASPIDALANYSVDLFGISFLKQGEWTTILNLIFALIVFGLTRKWKVFLSLGISFVTGFFINQWMSVGHKIFPRLDLFSEIDKVTMLNGYGLIPAYVLGIFGMFMLAMGIASMIAFDVFLTPYDDIALYLETKTKNYSLAKSILDGTCLLVALVFGFIIGRPFSQINIFSVVIVLGLGPIIGLFIKMFKKGTKQNEIK